MSKTNTEVKEVKEVKLNTSYIKYIEYLVKNKVKVEIENKKVLESKYNEIVKLKFQNLTRVSKRVSREKLITLKAKLLKENSIRIEEYIKVDFKLRNISKKREKKSNYLSI